MLQDIDATNQALFLDLDGTLIDIAPTPDTVFIPDDLVPLLGSLSEILGGALAIITGRRITDVDQLLAPLKLVTAGVHGGELRTAGHAIERGAALPVVQATLGHGNIA